MTEYFIVWLAAAAVLYVLFVVLAKAVDRFLDFLMSACRYPTTPTLYRCCRGVRGRFPVRLATGIATPAIFGSWLADC